MIVWDSREAEERNARQLLAERTRDVRKARRRVHTTTAAGVVSGGVVAESLWNLACHWSASMVVLAGFGLLAGLAGLALWPRTRRAVREVIPFHEARLRYAQENHDRVFGGQR